MKKFLFLTLLLSTCTICAADSVPRRELGSLYDNTPVFFAASPEPTDDYKPVDPTTDQAAAIVLRYLESLEPKKALYASTIWEAVQKLSRAEQLNMAYGIIQPLLIKKETKEPRVDEHGNNLNKYEIRKLSQEELKTASALFFLTKASSKINSDPNQAQFIKLEQEVSAQAACHAEALAKAEKTAPRTKKRCTIL